MKNERYHTPGQALEREPLNRLPFRGKTRDINPRFPCAHSGMNLFTPLISLGNKIEYRSTLSTSPPPDFKKKYFNRF